MSIKNTVAYGELTKNFIKCSHCLKNNVFMNIGHQVTDMKKLLDIENALIVKVKHLTPGKLRMDIRSDGPHSVRVTGRSSDDFVVVISPKYLVTVNGTEHELLTGITNIY